MCDEDEDQPFAFKLQRRSADVCCALEAAEGLLELGDASRQRDAAILYLIRHAHTEASALDHELTARLEDSDEPQSAGAQR